MNKQCQYILLPTKEASNIYTQKGILFYEPYPVKCAEPFHLYILSDDEIKEGDWFISDDRNRFGDPENWILCKCEEIKGKDYLMFKGIGYTLGYNAFKIIATTDPEFNKPSNKVVGNMSLNVMKNGIPKISQLDIEYIVNLYNEKGKEVNIKKLANDEYLPYQEGRVDIQTGLKREGFVKGYNKCLQDNADKKFTLEDIRYVVWKSIYLKEGFDKEGFSFYKDDNEIMDECIQSLTKEQPKNDTLIVEYEYTAKCYIHRPIPKLKDGGIVIHKT